jgi:hypothetical protein
MGCSNEYIKRSDVVVRVFLLGTYFDYMDVEMNLQERGKAVLLDELLGIIADQDIQIERLERNAAPKIIQLGRLILGDTQCRLYFAEDGKMHMYCGRGAQEFIKFAPEPTDEIMMYGFGAKP